MTQINSNQVSPACGCPEPLFAADKCSMIEIGDDHYAAIALLTTEAIGSREFFNGSVAYDCAEFGSRLTATLIIYRDPDDPDTITGIVPVWWEFATTSPDGRPAVNDFSFNELKQLMIDN